jgi:hypothetical protein
MIKILFQEADFYGASKLIFGDKPLPICYQATWMHGISPVLREIVSGDVLINYQERHLPIHLVNNEETVKNLDNEGIKSIAVGMPYIYTKAHSENKRNKILFRKVFMPPHSILANQEFDYSKWRVIIKKYNCDAICIGGNDYINVINKKINFGDVKVLKGADAGDNSSLTRISQMFYSSSEMITNSQGSHLTYAAASGVKVKVIDEIYELHEEELQNNYISKIMKLYPKKYQKSFERYHATYRGPDEIASTWNSRDAKEQEEYANYLLGTEHRKEPKIIEDYLTVDNTMKKIGFASHLLFNKISNKLVKISRKFDL